MHFYEKLADGSIVPRHFVEMSSRPGELRASRIADARKHGWYGSVTTIQGMLDKPALNDWRVMEHLKAVFALGSLEGFSNLEDFCKEIKRLTQAALDKAPKDGTDFHDVLDRYFTNSYDKFDDKERMICEKVDHVISQTFGGMSYIPEQSFVHSMGFGGKVDLHHANGNTFVVDYKTKNSCDKWKPSKMHYPEMAMQLAAYRVGLGLDNARCANIFICLEDGAVEFHEWDSAELDKQFANFTDLLRIWLRNAGYIPGKPQ